MDNALFLKNVLKTFANKEAQLGLRRAAGNRIRTHVAHAAFGLYNEVGEVFEVLSSWLLGDHQFHRIDQAKLKDELGDIGYFLRILARYHHVKLPKSTKKVSLPKGVTRQEACFQLLSLSRAVASAQKKMFYGPILKDSGEVTQKGNPILVMDLANTQVQEATRAAKIKLILEDIVPLYWALVYELTGTAPATVFEGVIAKLAVRYPDGFFSAEKETNKDPEAEAHAQL